jgi:NSS family neurotransmitter:Na+ symporter
MMPVYNYFHLYYTHRGNPGAISWFWVMKKEELLEEINKGALKLQGNLWHGVGKFIYVPLVVVLCMVTLFIQISF